MSHQFQRKSFFLKDIKRPDKDILFKNSSNRGIRFQFGTLTFSQKACFSPKETRIKDRNGRNGRNRLWQRDMSFGRCKKCSHTRCRVCINDLPTFPRTVAIVCDRSFFTERPTRFSVNISSLKRHRVECQWQKLDKERNYRRFYVIDI